jgi:hypothetical protein
MSTELIKFNGINGIVQVITKGSRVGQSYTRPDIKSVEDLVKVVGSNISVILNEVSREIGRHIEELGRSLPEDGDQKLTDQLISEGINDLYSDGRGGNSGRPASVDTLRYAKIQLGIQEDLLKERNIELGELFASNKQHSESLQVRAEKAIQIGATLPEINKEIARWTKEISLRTERDKAAKEAKASGGVAPTESSE